LISKVGILANFENTFFEKGIYITRENFGDSNYLKKKIKGQNTNKNNNKKNPPKKI